MSINITRRDIQAAHDYASRSLSRARDPERGSAGQVLDKLLETGEVLAGAAAVGVASGRFGPLNIANTPIPLDLVGGIGGHLLGFWIGGKTSDHIHNFSNGVLAGYVTKLGVGVGNTLRAKAGQVPFTTMGEGEEILSSFSGERARMHGGMPAYGAGAETGAAPSGGPLTEAELAALAQQVR